jgi:hypothetical protein
VKARKRTLAISDIVIPNDYPTTVDYDALPGLMAEIEQHGIEKRIEVYERGTRYILLHGRALLEAAKRLKHDEIKALVYSDYRPVAPKRKPPRTPLPNERELVRNARKGDEAARNRIVDHYYRLATTLAGKSRKKLERADADSVAFDAIRKAIDTWEPKKAKLSTWIGQKVKGELTTLRRELRKQSGGKLTWVEEKERWLRPSRNAKVIPIADNVVRIERLDDPNIHVIAKVKKRKRGIAKHPGEVLRQEEIDERVYRSTVRAGHRYGTLARLLKERPHFNAWLKRRKYVNRQDQRIAELLFVETMWVEWDVKIGEETYVCDLQNAEWLPDEVCEELGITRGRLNAAVTRICKTITGFTDHQLIALDDVRAVEREERIRAIPVPEPNPPRGVKTALTAIGREPTFAEAARAVAEYWLRLIRRRGEQDERGIAARIIAGDGYGDTWCFNPRVSAERVQQVLAPANLDRRQREIANDVADAIRGKSGPDYLRLAQCIAIVKRHG